MRQDFSRSALRFFLAALLSTGCDPAQKQFVVGEEASSSSSAGSDSKVNSSGNAPSTRTSPEANDPASIFLNQYLLGRTWLRKGEQACSPQLAAAEFPNTFFTTTHTFIRNDQILKTDIVYEDAACTKVFINYVATTEIGLKLSAGAGADEVQALFLPLGDPGVYSKLGIKDKKLYQGADSDPSFNGLSEATRYRQLATSYWFEEVVAPNPASAAAGSPQAFIEQTLLGHSFRLKDSSVACRSENNSVYYDTTITFVSSAFIAITWTYYADAACTQRTSRSTSRAYVYSLAPSATQGVWNLDWSPAFGIDEFTLLKVDGKRLYLGQKDASKDGLTAATRPVAIAKDGYYEDVRP